jgi:hypothetical protein
MVVVDDRSTGRTGVVCLQRGTRALDCVSPARIFARVKDQHLEKVMMQCRLGWDTVGEDLVLERSPYAARFCRALEGRRLSRSPLRVCCCYMPTRVGD